MHRIFTTFFLLLVTGSSLLEAQPTVTTGLNVTQYLQQFAGAGVTIVPNSATITGHPNQIGIFNFANNNPNVGVSNGLVLSSGDVNFVQDYIPNTNGIFEASEGYNGPGDPGLDQLSTANTNDAVVLEFKFVPSGDTARFEYMFASDEYEEWAPPNGFGFNDVFGFFISGPGIVGEENIALIPGTTTPVSINNINPVTNQQFYNTNDPGFFGTAPIPNFTYDGYSDVLVAQREVIPCDTYTLSLRLADAGDDILDTGVFLVGNSFGSSVSISTTSPFTSPGGNFVVYEGANTAGQVGFTLFRDPNNTPQDTIEVFWGGDADLGTDYTVSVPNPDSIIFPAGQDELFVEITALSDTIVEGADTVKFQIPLGTSACGGQDTLSSNLIILDCPPLVSNAADTVASCDGASVTLQSQVSGGVAPLDYDWPQLGVNTADASLTPTTDSLVQFKVWDVCNDTLTDEIFVQLLQPTAPLSITTSPDDTICGGTPTTLQVFPVDGTGVYQYDWNGQGFEDTLSVSPLSTQSYDVTVDDGCTQETATINVEVLPPMSTTLVSGDVDICNGAQASFQVSATSGSGTYTYEWVNNTTGQVVGGNNDFLVVNPTTTTSYTVTISDGCSPDTSYTVTATVAEPVTLTVSSDSTICEGDDVTLTATGAGGFNDYTYTWSTPGESPQTGSSITVSPTATTTYTVEMTEATCQQTPLSESVVVEVINTPTASFSLNPNPLCEGAPIDVEFTGNIPNTGTPAFDWDFGVANVQSGSGQGPYVISYDDAGEYNIDLAVEMTQNGVTCPAVSTTEQMVVEPQPVADFDVPSPQCLAGNAYEFVATGSRDADIDFTWSFQDAQPGTASSVDVSNVKFQSAGVKSVTLDLSAAGGLCTDEITKPVTVWPNPDAPDMQGDSICPGYEATLFVVQPVAGEQYIWNGGAGANDYIGTQLVTPRLDRTQNYTVYSRDANGCESLTRTPVQAYVHPQAELNISYSPEQPETPNAIVSFRPLASIPIVAWNWQFGDRAGSTDEQPVHQYQEPGTKSVAVSAVDENGCISSEIIELEVEETPAGGLPTGFSPNGDGLNDVYEADLSHMTEVSFRVYSRMGQLVFESSTPTFEWDGTGPNGSTLPEGTYPYILEYTLYNGVSDTRTGTITILR